MGGKSYYCDYCQCFIKNDINVRKVHNTGLAHNIAKYSYMRCYEDPRKLLAEESAKLPCLHYLKGYCKFDLFCQYTHFSTKQLEDLRKIVWKLERRPGKKHRAKVCNLPVKLPWHASSIRSKLKQRSLPPSLQKIDLFHFKNISELPNNEWG